MFMMNFTSNGALSEFYESREELSEAQPESIRSGCRT
jgi:hypothetical protein